MYKPRIHITIVTRDSISTSSVKAPNVTNAMYDAAYDLVYTMMTNKRRTASLYTKNEKKLAKVATKADAKKVTFKKKRR